MKQFPVVLNDILGETGLTQAELGNLSSLGQKKISNLVNGVIRADKEDFLALYSASVPFTHEQRGRLAYAHIEDELPPAAFTHLNISIPENVLHELPEKGMEHLSGRAQEALRYLLSLQDKLPNLGELLTEQAIALGWKEKITRGLKADTVRKVVDTLTQEKPAYRVSPRSKNRP